MSSSLFSLRAAAGALASAGFALAALGAAVMPSTASAAAPMVKTQAPGFYRMMLGAFEVTALSDGTVDVPADTLLHGPAGSVAAKLAAAHLTSPVESSVIGFLVNTGDKLVLIDTGAGALFGPTLGQLGASLRAAGYQPEQVDEVLLTHAHPDHVGGLMGPGGVAFAKATVRLDDADAQYWLSTARMDAAPAPSKGFFQGAMASLNPYAEAGRLKPFAAGAEVLPGIRAIAARGHSAGHTVYAVESQGQRMLLIGDLIHVGAVQLEDPRVTIAYDSDEPAAAATRRTVFAQAAKENLLIGAAHLPFPGLGRLRQAGSSYRWLPVDYTTRLK
jgi:glyoxylase-like metal-dependent hydrolase (beta-lactamase superfamily II)